MRPNPKYQLEDPEDFRSGIERRLRHAHRPGMVPIGLDWLSGQHARGVVAGKGTRTLAWVDTRRRIIELAERGMALGPTTVWWLMQLAAVMPEWRDYDLAELVHGDETNLYGITLGELVQTALPVHEEGWENPFDRDEEYVPRAWDYYVAEPFEDLDFFHATLASRMPSIAERGILPSSLGPGRIEGWSPGWNWSLENAVYLFVDPSRAMELAETLAYRFDQDTVVLRVRGDWVEDPRLLIPDEDVLRDEYSDSPLYSAVDPDFPPWVTGAEARHPAIAYRGIIRPEFVYEYATVAWVPEIYEEHGETMVEPAYRVSFAR